MGALSIVSTLAVFDIKKAVLGQWQNKEIGYVFIYCFFLLC